MRTSCATAFTILELTVVLATLGLVALVLAPAMARTRPANKLVHCLNNNRQLCRAWQMYAADAGDVIVYSSDDGTGTSNPLNQYAWVQNHMDFSSGNRANWDPSYLKATPLWPYCGQNYSLWKCPSDTSYVTVQGQPKPRTRSTAMNFYLGGFAGTDGGWSFVTGYRIFLKRTELLPSPSGVFVFLDMRPDAISWGNFMTDMSGYRPAAASQYRLADYPGNLHDGASGFSFGDGHVEVKRWRDPRTMPPANNLPATPFATPGNPDVAWLQDHATRSK